MIWLTWRQLRTHISVGGAALAGLVVYLILLGLSVRHAYSAGLANCVTGDACNQARIAFTGRFETTFTLLNCLLIALPGMLGAFWGAPTVAQELESGTYRMIWTQSAPRRTWLATKMLGVVLSSTVVAGVAAALLTWAAAPYDRVTSRFAFLAFDGHHIMPIAYAMFATMLGVLVGLSVKRLLVAIALTLTLFAAIQAVVPLTVRRHLEPPVQKTLSFSPATINGQALTFDESSTSGTSFVGYTIPGAWLLHRSYLLNSQGRPADLSSCFHGSPSKSELVSCVTSRHVHWTLTYQPANRYWTFQWLEFGGYLLGGLILAAISLWRIPRVTG